MHVGGLQRFIECVFSTAKCVGCLLWRVHFDHRKACKRLVELSRARLDHLKERRRLAEVPRMRFLHRNESRRLVEL